MTVSIVLFTSDLRLHDQPALRAALDATDAVVPLFVRDDAVAEAGFAAPNRAAFLADCLTDLDHSLRERGGRLVILPWLNRVDHGWLKDVTAGATTVVTVDDHYIEGGQGVMIGSALQSLHFTGRVVHLGVDRIPSCGANDEVLADHGLDAAGIAKAIGG